jgi:hypothetical protein
MSEARWDENTTCEPLTGGATMQSLPQSTICLQPQRHMASSSYAVTAPARLPRGIHWEICSGHLIYKATGWDGEPIATVRVPLNLPQKREVILLLEDVLNLLAPQQLSAPSSEAPEWSSWQRPVVLRLVPS